MSRTAPYRGALLLAVALVGLGACGNDDADVAAPVVTAQQSEIEESTEFGTLDANGDSYLDADEIAETADGDALFDAWDADRDSELDHDEIAGNAFRLWDFDRNGMISEAEWKDNAEIWYGPAGQPRVFADHDGDGDSELDADEFAESLDTSAIGETWSASTLNMQEFKNAYFELYDADNDGKVSEGEFTRGSAIWGTPTD